MDWSRTAIRRYALILAKIMSVLLVLWWTFFVIQSHGLCAVSTIEGFIPLAVLFVASIAWRSHFTGGLLFILLGILFIGWMRGCMFADTYFFVCGPLFLTGVFFTLAGLLRESE
ncbi:MAG: hypothetical protein V3T21_04300 [Candidatus Margulisiibacteriota bacterium]